MEHLPDAEAEPGVEHPDHQPQSGIQVLRLQRGVDVADVVLVGDGERIRRRYPGSCAGAVPTAPMDAGACDAARVGDLPRQIVTMAAATKTLE